MLRSVLTAFIAFSLSVKAIAEINFRHHSEFRPSDYLNRDNRRRDTSFDTMKVADLGLNLGVGSDCGNIRLDASLKASLQNIFKTEYFGDLGKQIIDSSWMLVICYLSPNWCSILRHFRLNANFIGRMRQNQCDAINKYIDSRVSESHRARQECVSNVLSRGGNTEDMATECGNRKLYEFDLQNWAGSKLPKGQENKLLQDSAKWAKYDDSEQQRIVQLAKGFVGDSIYGKGRVSIEYGPKGVYIPPKNYLIKLVKGKKKKLCTELLKKIDSNPNGVESAITDEDLRQLNGNSGNQFIDRQTVRYLSMLPFRKRSQYCQKIAWALANAQFSHDTGQALNFLSLVSQNPNLPEERKREALSKKRILQDDLENIKMEQEQTNAPLNTIASEITREGKKYESRVVERENQVVKARTANYRTNSLFYNCVTPAMCSNRRRR